MSGGAPGLDALSAIESAEVLFELLDVPYDPHVLAVARLHVLRRYGEAAAEIEATPGLAPEERRARHREALAAAHARFATTSPREAPAFRGFEDRTPLVRLGRRG